MGSLFEEFLWEQNRTFYKGSHCNISSMPGRIIDILAHCIGYVPWNDMKHHFCLSIYHSSFICLFVNPFIYLPFIHLFVYLLFSYLLFIYLSFIHSFQFISYLVGHCNSIMLSDNRLFN